MTDLSRLPSARSLQKRSQILDAATDLIGATGFERTSVDAVAERADVSKRTVYDYFGDKAGMFRAALERTEAELLDAVGRAIEEELVPGEVHRALASFASRITSATFSSSTYVTYRRLLASGGPARDPDPDRSPESLLARHLATMPGLDVPDPRRAAQHLVALTLSVALERLERSDLQPDDTVAAIIDDGVRVFLRAYATRDDSGAGRGRRRPSEELPDLDSNQEPAG